MGKRKKTLEKRREETWFDMCSKLHIYHRYALIRPTGFGKTWMMAKLTKEYKKVLYLYPHDIVKETAKEVVSLLDGDENLISEDKENDSVFANIQFMTYMKLIRLSDEEIKAFDYDLILFDECHRLGAEKTKPLVEKIFKYHWEVDKVGATATPERMDAFDVISYFFGPEATAYPYSLHNCIRDGIIPKPTYIFNTYDIETNLKEAALTEGQDPRNILVKEVLQARLNEIATIYGMPNILKKTFKKYRSDEKYQKYIVFFANYTHLKEKKEEVESWFKDAFPKWDVHSVCVTSKNKVERENVKKLKNLTPANKRIDLICCIDMLDMGYHVNDLTGVIMYRATSSNIKFAQEMGRAISTGTKKSGLIFDVVDNLHRKAAYELYDKKKATSRLKNGGKNIGDKPFFPDEFGNLVTIDLDGNYIRIDKDTKERSVIDKEEFERVVGRVSSNANFDVFTDFTYDDMWYMFTNTLYEKDLVAEDHEATKRELLCKLIAEDKWIRIQKTALEYMRVWCAEYEKPFPVTRSEIESLEETDIKLSKFAEWRNITLQDIIDGLMSIVDKQSKKTNKNKGKESAA